MDERRPDPEELLKQIKQEEMCIRDRSSTQLSGGQNSGLQLQELYVWNHRYFYLMNQQVH